MAALLKDNPRFRYLFLIDAVSLLVVIGFQAGYLDFILMKRSEDYTRLYFFVALDFGVFLAIMKTLLFSYRFFSQKHQDFPDGDGKHLKPKWYARGTLPMSYYSWIFYIIVLLAKLTFICYNLDVSKKYFNPQILQVCLALSTVVFFLIVENHNWAKKSSESYSFTTNVCKKNGIEIFDSVEMLELLFNPNGLSFTIQIILFFLASFNFILPTLSLYRLSLSEFGVKRTPSSFSLKVLHNVLRITFVDVPFFVIRLRMWIVEGDLSVFMMKNFFNILMALRELYLDVCIYFKSKRGSDEDISEQLANENSIPLNDVKTEDVKVSTNTQV